MTLLTVLFAIIFYPISAVLTRGCNIPVVLALQILDEVVDYYLSRVGCTTTDPAA